MKKTDLIRNIQLPEFMGNGDELSTEQLIHEISKVLPDQFTLIGLYDLYDMDNDPTPYAGPMIILIGDKRTYEKVKEINYSFTSGFILHFEWISLYQVKRYMVKLKNAMSELGRYPKSESEGDDFFISCIPDIQIDPEKQIITVNYWYDDSTR